VLVADTLHQSSSRGTRELGRRSNADHQALNGACQVEQLTKLGLGGERLPHNDALRAARRGALGPQTGVECLRQQQVPRRTWREMV